MPLTRRDYFNLVRSGASRPSADLFVLMTQVETLAREAGIILLYHYSKLGKGDRDALGVEIKEDGSPATVADRESSAFLVRGLSRLTSIPVISEENDTDGKATYWAVDPLDGTKEFLDRTGGFSIKIALIADCKPVLALIYCPAQRVLYASIKDGPAVQIAKGGPMTLLQTRLAPETGRLTTLFNQKHSDPAEYFIQRAALAAKGLVLPFRPRTKPGLPRNLQIASGQADIHLASGHGQGPLRGSGFVWDSGPDDLILRNAGGGMINLDGTPLSYDRPRERRPAYIAFGDPALRTKLAC